MKSPVLGIRVHFLPDPDQTISEITDPGSSTKKGTQNFFSLLCEVMYLHY